MLSLADFFSILTHNLIKSHIRDGSRHLDCCRASFYNDALQYMGARRSFKEREVDSEPLALLERRVTCFKDQGSNQDLAVHYNTRAGLLQTAIKIAFVAKTMSSLSEYDLILDVRELFECGIDLGQDACISTDARRIGGTAQAQRGSAWRRSRSLHVQSEREIGSAGWIGC